ncbi:hypothetical protein CDL12_10407 [Handroanthus impetiginosus]|uniref:DUF247 domain-containing protein n=1 Tax=Handroanthus impetiginosus TaxID=429701 RepID=A0A2G9HHA3_9LAMI|nr:hypothetical protein CDL12_10407 [Handroanthus impetiginosus]
MAQYGQTSNEGHYRKIQRIPELLLKEEKNRENYIPKVVSIGPYHHGKRELRVAESLKPMALELIVSGDKEKEDYYYEEIEKNIIHIRNFYEQDCTDLYSDDELVRMMLLDACFIVIHMEASCIERDPQSGRKKMTGFTVEKRTGFTVFALDPSTVFRDMFLVENQIPLWIVKLLLTSRYERNKSKELLDRYITTSLFGDFPAKRNLPPWGNDQEELHLLEAFHRLVVFGFVHETKETCLSFIIGKFFCFFEAKERTVGDSNIDLESRVSSLGRSRFQSRMNYLTAGAWGKLFRNVRNEGDYAKRDKLKFINFFHSVTNLKGAGIHFRPNQTLSLKDVKFESNCIFGKLQLAFWRVSTHTEVFFMNMVAYELSPQNFAPAVVTTYINLMKLLIMRPEDVKMLRENKILCDMLGNDKEILKAYQGINTLDIENTSIFYEVKHKIQAYRDRKARRWIGELVNIYFCSPWTFIALLATTYLLVLTTLQTIYTINPK